jgi:hypothetical protein
VERAGLCGRQELRFQDGVQDDVAPDEVHDFLTSIQADASDFIHVSLSGAGFRDFDWCAERADFFRDQYVLLAPTGGLAVSEGWNVWSREDEGPWIGPVADSFENYFGDQCFGQYSWCSEVLLENRSIAIHPGDAAVCEASDLVDGCGSGDVVLSIVIAPNRTSACGF